MMVWRYKLKVAHTNTLHISIIVHLFRWKIQFYLYACNAVVRDYRFTCYAQDQYHTYVQTKTEYMQVSFQELSMFSIKC